MTDDPQRDPPTPALPKELRRATRTTIGLAVVGLVLFIAGFAFGSIEDAPSPGVVAGGAGVVVVGVVGILWVRRVGKD